MSERAGSEPAGDPPLGADEAAQLSTAAQARLDAGDREGAIALWRRAYAALPGGFGYAPRRAAAALAIAAAEEGAYRDSADPARLRAAIAALDAYLGGLDPTDDENRAGVEDRKAELSAMLQRAARPVGPAAPPVSPKPAPRGFDRRAGQAAAVFGVGATVAGAIALAGVVGGRAADRELAGIVAKPCTGDDPDDPCGSDDAREEAKAQTLAEGLRSNRMALIGGSLAGALLLAGLAAVVAGAIRGRPRVQARGLGLGVRF